jgi:hypothetical protein
MRAQKSLVNAYRMAQGPSDTSAVCSLILCEDE